MSTIKGTDADTTGINSGADAFGIDALFRADVTALIGSGVITEDKFTHLDDPQEYDITLGSQPAVRDDTYSGGVLKMPNGGTGTAYIWPKNGIPAGAGAVNPVIANPRTTPWACGTLLKFNATPVSGQLVWLATLQTAVDDGTTLWFSGVDSETVLQAECDGSVGGSGTTGKVACNTFGTIGDPAGITVGQFFRAVIAWNPTTGKLAFGINGKKAAELTPGTKMTVTKSSPACIVSGASGLLRVDALWWGWQPPTS